MGNEVLNIFSFNNFFEKSNIFEENGEKNFGESPFFRRKDHFVLKMNITFFIKNQILNIFMRRNYFGKIVFSEETAKNCSEGAFDHLLKIL